MFISMQLSLLPKYWIMHLTISPLTVFCSLVETCCDIQRDLYNATYVKHAKHGQRNAPHLGPKQRCALSRTIPNCALFLKFWKICLVQENCCCFEQTIYKLWMVDEKDCQKLPKIGSEMAKHVSRDQNIIGPVPNASSESTLWWRDATFTNNSPLWKQIVKSIKNTIWDTSTGTGSFNFNYLATKPVQSLLFYAPKIYLNKDKTNENLPNKSTEARKPWCLFIYPNESLSPPSLQGTCRVFFTQQVDINNKHCILQFICLHWYFMSAMHSHRVKSSMEKSKTALLIKISTHFHLDLIKIWLKEAFMRIHAIDGVLFLFNTVFTALYSKSLNQAVKKDKYSKETAKHRIVLGHS